MGWWPWTRRDDTREAIRGIAESACPPDLIAFGRRHNIENFAEVTWQSGFCAGWDAALKHAAKRHPQGDKNV